jgi:hypothetical protein
MSLAVRRRGSISLFLRLAGSADRINGEQIPQVLGGLGIRRSKKSPLSYAGLVPCTMLATVLVSD